MGAALAITVGAGVWLAIEQPWRTPSPIAAERLAARLELAAGEVVLASGEDSTPTRLLSGTPLPEGAIVETAAGARALIRLSDGARVYLDEATRVELADGLVLHRGRAWLDAPGLDEGQTPAQHKLGDATVALSDGGASLQLTDKGAEIYVAEGLAIVAGPGGRREVAAGELARISGDGEPTIEPVAFWDDWTGGMGDRSGLGRSIGAGSGSLYAVDRAAAAGSPALPLQIQSQSVKVVMRDDLAETLVDQRFFNPSGRDVEGWYWFTIPEGAQLVGFALETNGQLVEAEIVEKKQAAATYEAAIQRANDPALLEWIDDRTVRARIFPVPAVGTRRIVVRYQQLLTEAEGKLRYRYPLAGPPGRDTATIEEFSLLVDLGDLGEQHEVATLAEARVEDSGRRVTMRRSGYTPRADFQLELTRKPDHERAPLRLSVLDPGGDQARYVMVRYTPDLRFDETTMPKGEVVIVVDTSAAGDPAEYQTRLAVTEALLRSLSAGDKFVVMSADERAHVLWPESGLAEAGPDAISAALQRLAEHGTGGATDLGAIFEVALQRVHGLEQPAVVYVGDGMATSGDRGGDALAERLRRSMTGSRARLFTVGVGQDVDDRLLQSLARIGGGISLRVDAPEQAIMRALELSGALKTPTITDLDLDLGEGLDDVFMSTTGKLSRGQELVVLARTHHDLPEEVTIHGRLGGEAFSRTHELVRKDDVLMQIVPRLWAAAYIERLLGDSRGPDAVRGKMLSLGLEYGLMSPATSFLALDSESAYAAMGVQRRARRFGGVRLTADASHLVERKDEEASVTEVLVGLVSAPIGCSLRSDDANMAAKESPAPVQTRSEAAEPAPPPDRAADAPAAFMPGAQEEPVEDVAEAPAYEDEASKSDGSMGGRGGAAGGPRLAKKAKHRGEEGRMGRKTDAAPSSTSSSSASTGFKGNEGTLEERDGDIDKLRALATITSPVARGRMLPCSDASARGLSHRRILWSTRLSSATTMTDALEVYEASAGSCEIGGWKDQRTFLQLLQERAQTEADIGLLLAHFSDESDAARWLARALLRRLVDPSLVAAVHNALFGSTVDWHDVDRRVILAVSIDDKLQILRDALARSPGDPQGELRLIEVLAAAERLPEALTRGRRLRDEGMMTPVLARSLGEIMVAHGQTEEARRMFSEIVEFDPHSAPSRRLLGDIFLRHGWHDAAYRQYADLISLAPDDAAAPIRLARAAAGTGRVDEALRTLRKIAAGEGRPGATDPRRYARLHAAALLGALLERGSDEIPKASVARELRRLQLFDGPTTWVLLVWQDLDAQLVLTHADPAAADHLGDPIVAGDTGLFALQAPASGLPPVSVRHAGEISEHAVAFRKITIRFDGSAFTVEEEPGTLPARQSRLLAAAAAEPRAEAAPAEPPAE